MPAKDLGTKHTCFKCGVKFYDLKKPDPLCPKCGADQREAAAQARAAEKLERKRPSRAVPEEPEVPEEVLEDEETAVAEDEEPEEIPEEDADEDL